MPQDPRVIANKFVQLAERTRAEIERRRDEVRRSNGEIQDLDPLLYLLTAPQIEKLVYYAYAYHLDRCNQRLVYEKPSAGRFGPMFNTLVRALEPHGLDPLVHLLTKDNKYHPYQLTPDESSEPCAGLLSPQEEKSVKNVWSEFVRRPLRSHQLSSLIKGDEEKWKRFSTGVERQITPIAMSDEDVMRFYALSRDKYGRLNGENGDLSEAA